MFSLENIEIASLPSLNRLTVSYKITFSQFSWSMGKERNNLAKSGFCSHSPSSTAGSTTGCFSQRQFPSQNGKALHIGRERGKVVATEK